MCRRVSSISVIVLTLSFLWLAPAAARAQDKLDVVLVSLYKRSLEVNARTLRTMFPGLTIDGRAWAAPKSPSHPG